MTSVASIPPSSPSSSLRERDSTVLRACLDPQIGQAASCNSDSESGIHTWMGASCRAEGSAAFFGCKSLNIQAAPAVPKMADVAA